MHGWYISLRQVDASNIGLQPLSLDENAEIDVMPSDNLQLTQEMMKMQNKEFQVFISAAFVGLLYYLRIMVVPIVVLLIAMIIDYLTG